MTRQQANYKILEILKQQIEQQPDIRFSQLLKNMDIVLEIKDDFGNLLGWAGEFYVESEWLLQRINRALNVKSTKLS